MPPRRVRPADALGPPPDREPRRPGRRRPRWATPRRSRNWSSARAPTPSPWPGASSPTTRTPATWCRRRTCGPTGPSAGSGVTPSSPRGSIASPPTVRRPTSVDGAGTATRSSTRRSMWPTPSPSTTRHRRRCVPAPPPARGRHRRAPAAAACRGRAARHLRPQPRRDRRAARHLRVGGQGPLAPGAPQAARAQVFPLAGEATPIDPEEHAHAV